MRERERERENWPTIENHCSFAWMKEHGRVLCLQARNILSLACMSMTNCPCVMLSDLATCYSLESA
jgi:hypothetical protein